MLALRLTDEVGQLLSSPNSPECTGGSLFAEYDKVTDEDGRTVERRGGALKTVSFQGYMLFYM